MKFLGIDYGTKRIGLAVSDAEGKFAFPKAILENDGKAIDKIKEIIHEEEVAEMVIGESVDFHGKPNKVAAEIETLISKLESLNLPVHKQQEFLTSVEARRLQGSSRKADAAAAALILQRYLDKINLL